MNLKKIVSIASLALVIAGGLSAASPGRWEQWLNSYYQNPQPDQVVQAVYGLSDAGYFERQGAVATSIGFFSQVFAANPDRVDGWFARFSSLPQSEQRLLAGALWYAGNPKGERLLRDLAADSAYRNYIARMIATNTGNVGATPVLSESSLNLRWGAFLASGSEQHVTSILTGMGRGSVGEAARVSLAFNAAQHPKVLEVCRAELDRQPNQVRSLLRAVINEAEQKQAPRI
jgi:hypothetical protein